jgi:hypothetical protein
MRHALLFACVLATRGFGGDQALRPIPSHAVAQAVRAFRLQADGTTEETSIQAHSVMLDATMPSGAARKTNLFVLFDPAAGFYQWFFGIAYDIEQPTDFGMLTSGEMIAYTTKGGLTLFRVGGGRLGVRESRARAGSADAAVAQSLREATAWLPDFERGDEANWKGISLRKLLGADFLAAKGHAELGPLKLVQVSFQDGKWHVIVQGQWKEELVLDSKLEVVDHKQSN